MSTPVPLSTAPRIPTAAQLLRVFAAHLAAWSLLSAMGAATASNELARLGAMSPYLDLLCESWKTSLLQAIVGVILYAVMVRWPSHLASTQATAVLYCATLIVFLPLDAVYRGAWQVAHDGLDANLAMLAGAVQAIERLTWFIDGLLTSGTFTLQAALGLRRQGLARKAALELAEKENLQLRLELEQSRMLGLRAQLEPHFLFNALNAISALVRADDGKQALSGIGRLSGLLRYALTATERQWVSIGEELAFVEDYLALQKLRYGTRLRIAIEGASDDILNAACPPLLLQPLIENALRHDLDCHAEASDIGLRFQATERELLIAVSNPMAADGTARAPANPGLGLGLRHTATSLQLAFGPPASLSTTKSGGRFVVELRLPLQPWR